MKVGHGLVGGGGRWVCGGEMGGEVGLSAGVDGVRAVIWRGFGLGESLGWGCLQLLWAAVRVRSVDVAVSVFSICDISNYGKARYRSSGQTNICVGLVLAPVERSCS